MSTERSARPSGRPDGDFEFLLDGSGMGARIRAFDWSATPLGPIEGWPQSLKTATGILLRSPVPIVMLWGEDGIMIYNDAYSEFAGGRHPQLLGSKVREGWPEVADFNDRVMKVGLAGGTLAYVDQELTLYRRGAPEQVWMNLDYSPVPDESGRPAGVIAIVVETTKRVLAERRIVAERERLARMFEQTPSFMAVLRGSEHVFELVNPAHRRLTGDREVIGKPAREALPELERQGFIELLDRVYRSGEAHVGTAAELFLQRSPDGPIDRRYIDFVYQPLFDTNGAVSGIFVEGTDVTERRRDEQLSYRLAAIVESSEDAIVSKSLDGIITSWNRGAERLFGYTAEEVIGQSILLLIPPDRRAEEPAILARIRCGERTEPYETVRLRKGGSPVDVSLSVSPIRDVQGRIIGASKIARDITERRKAERHRDLLINELNHRVKNTLATVQSIAAQSFPRGSADPEARAAFEGRLFALSDAHSLLTREHWEGVGLRELTLQALEPFANGGEPSGRFTVEGEDIHLRPNVALAVAMAFHELATNATKYGALSNDAGRIAITWRSGDGRLRLRWEERNGPAVAPPARKGFGSRLVERGLAHELNGIVRLDYAPEGVVCEVDMPMPAGKRREP